MKRIEPPGSLGTLFIPNCPSHASSIIFADIWAQKKYPVAVVIGQTLPDAENKCEDIAGLTESICPQLGVRYHSFDQAPGPNHPDAFEKVCDRLSLLSSLREISVKESKSSFLLVATTFEALLGPCPMLEQTAANERIIRSGSSLSYDLFCKELVARFDYSCEVLCEEPGQFAIRGGLIDVYPVNQDLPFRIDFFGDTVEEIRSFDPTSQRTTGKVSEIRILALENHQGEEREGAFFSYLPNEVLWHLEEPENLLHGYPLAFHETGKHATEKANLSWLWKRSDQLSDFFLSTSEIDAGAGVFDNTPR